MEASSTEVLPAVTVTLDPIRWNGERDSQCGSFRFSGGETREGDDVDDAVRAAVIAAFRAHGFDCQESDVNVETHVDGTGGWYVPAWESQS